MSASAGHHWRVPVKKTISQGDDACSQMGAPAWRRCGGRLRSGCLFVVSWWSRRYRRGSGSSHGHSMAWRLPGCFGGASAESEVSVPQGDSMLVSAVSVVSGLFQCCWSRVQCWVWCDENLSACDSEEARCSGCRAIRRSEQAPCVKNTIHQQPVNGPHSTRIRVSDPWVSWYHLLPLVRIRTVRIERKFA